MDVSGGDREEELRARRAAASRARARTHRRRRAVAGAGALVVLAAGAMALAGGRKHPAQHPAALAAASHPATKPVARRASGSLPTAAAQQAAVASIAATGLPVFCGGPRGNMVALTFDDGPGPYSHYVIKRLRRDHEKATWFLVSRNLPTYGSLVAPEQRFGPIGDHTVTHPDLVALSRAGQEQEIGDAQTALADESGQPVRLFRPPYGSRDASVDGIAQQLGMAEIIWDIDSADSDGADYAGIQANVERNLHPGAIILMHDNRGQTVRALPVILHAVARNHLRTVTIPELLAADPPSTSQLRSGRSGCRPLTAPLETGLGGDGAG